MPWLQVRLAISPEQAETYEDAFLEVGAVSVTFMDAEDQPIFEPELNTTPLWSHTHLLALFEDGTDAAAVLAQLDAAASAGKITPAAAANVRIWLTEPRYSDYAEETARHVTEGKWKELDDAFWTIIPFGTGGTLVGLTAKVQLALLLLSQVEPLLKHMTMLVAATGMEQE